ncbi:DnaJ domain-containing protein [Caulobacter sp. SLTY]|uniref:DnaJ C-terminal domain-containing protein n=1 Tax=Caulobacter sp. SLTY TaxID=2683262 RepID=UPI001412DD46|nr:DnaJ C-terminal domain-containing protein [Caulobacter sp. SLTY]NBB15309.1 DnaJ domain-containing protein [Caulobacter sp. SLTY]
MARDPYLELGVSRSAGADDIRKAFRKLAKQYHPDANPGDKTAEEKFKRVSGAFDILGDEEKRKKFDRGEIDAEGREQSPFGGRGGFGGNAGGGGWSPRGGAEGFDPADIFGDVFGQRGQGGPRGFGGFSTKGQDLRTRLDIDLEDAIRGAKKRIAFSDGRTLDLTIPKGAQDGQVLRLKGQGAQGRGGAGDALIELNIRNHPIYRREGDTLIMDVPITVPDAVLGGKVEAPTPDGIVALTVPKGSNSGQQLRLKGRGFIDAKGKRGDLVARLVVTLPDIAGPELEQFAQEWKAKRPYTPKKR